MRSRAPIDLSFQSFADNAVRLKGGRVITHLLSPDSVKVTATGVPSRPPRRQREAEQVLGTNLRRTMKPTQLHTDFQLDHDGSHYGLA